MDPTERCVIDLTKFPLWGEPIFELKDTCNEWFSSAEARKETLELLISESKKSIKQRVAEESEPWSSIVKDVVIYTHVICKDYDLSEAAKSLALELFDRYIFQLMRDVIETINTACLTDRRKMLYASKVMDRLHAQSLLRLLTSVQVASKIIDRDKVISPKQICEFLRLNGETQYDKMSILRSEIRLCELLKHKIDVPTIYGAMETLLALRKSLTLRKASSQVFSIAVHMLHMIYFKHDEIFPRLFTVLAIPENSTERRQAKVDTIWAGASVIIASLHFISFSLQEEAVQELTHDLKGVRQEYELRAFSWVLFTAFEKETTDDSS